MRRLGLRSWIRQRDLLNRRNGRRQGLRCGIRYNLSQLSDLGPNFPLHHHFRHLAVAANLGSETSKTSVNIRHIGSAPFHSSQTQVLLIIISHRSLAPSPGGVTFL